MSAIHACTIHACTIHACTIALLQSRGGATTAALLTVGAIRAAMSRAEAELEEYALKHPPADRYQADVLIQFVLERRRTLAQGCTALGIIGATVLRSTTPDAAMRIATEVLLPIASLAVRFRLFSTVFRVLWTDLLSILTHRTTLDRTIPPT